MKKFQELAQKTYAKFGKYAKAYHYSFSRTAVTKDAAPCMLFLGNHSSGKSSLINWLIGGDAVQDVGLAPTDDGFTILVFGESEEDICGPAAVSRLPVEFAGLKDFGNNFLQHLHITFLILQDRKMTTAKTSKAKIAPSIRESIGPTSKSIGKSAQTP